MKAVANFHPSYSDDYSFAAMGTTVHDVDQSGGYDTDHCILLKKNNRLTVLTGSGCSCWEGDYEGWQGLTKAELRAMATKWAADSYGAEKEMGKWILENIK